MNQFQSPMPQTNAVFTLEDPASSLPPEYLPKPENANAKNEGFNLDPPPSYDMFLNQNATTSAPFVVFSTNTDAVRIVQKNEAKRT